MNPNYVQRVGEDLEKLLDTQFIFPIETTQWLSPMVIVPKKNRKLRICVDYRKLNSQIKKDPFSLPFLDLVLNTVVGHEMYSFMDGYSGYNQLKMVKENTKKMSFIFEWGAYAYNVMPFVLCNAPATFQKIITQTFKNYVNDFMQVFLDDHRDVVHEVLFLKCYDQIVKKLLVTNIDNCFEGNLHGQQV
jgi:hypothetical protein